MSEFTDHREGVRITSKPGESREEFLKRERAWLAVYAQKRRRERKAD